jgi:uncharacterized Tic20 family protein
MIYLVLALIFFVISFVQESNGKEYKWAIILGMIEITVYLIDREI